MNFAPYQDQSPETSRSLSPPPPGQRRDRSFSPSTRSPPPPAPPQKSNVPYSDPWGRSAAISNGGGDLESGAGAGISSGGAGSGGDGGGDGAAAGFASARERVSEWETSLPLRLGIEAALAYVLLPPAGGVLLLVMEWRSDYVRFHAWQSSLVFTPIFVIHLIFSWSLILSWLLFAADILLIAFLALRAYRDADTLDRFEVPFFGRLASSILDDE